MIDYVTIEQGDDGTLVMIEPERSGLDRRAFKHDATGALSWAHYADWREHGPRARFYGYASRELPSSMTGA